jgi:hypothetical protein
MTIRRPSPALAVALLALFLALGSGAYATVRVNGRNIENRSIPGVKIKRNALTASEIQESTLRRDTAYVHVSGAVNPNGASQGSRRSFTSQRLGLGYYRLEFPQSTFTVLPLAMITPLSAQVTGTRSYGKPVDGKWRVDVWLSRDTIFSFEAAELSP